MKTSFILNPMAWWLFSCCRSKLLSKHNKSGFNMVKITTLMYSKSCLKRPLKRRPKLVFKTNYCIMQVKSITECPSFNTGQKYYRMLQSWTHSDITFWIRARFPSQIPWMDYKYMQFGQGSIILMHCTFVRHLRKYIFSYVQSPWKAIDLRFSDNSIRFSFRLFLPGATWYRHGIDRNVLVGSL